MNEWMDGCMDGWMDGWIDRSMDRQIDGQIYRQMDRWIDGQMDRWIDGHYKLFRACALFRYLGKTKINMKYKIYKKIFLKKDILYIY